MAGKQTNPFPPSGKNKVPMTQIVGIICKETIVVASESQYTAGHQKTFDAVNHQFFHGHPDRLRQWFY
jgi:hypothetical protein